jgi:neutral ceramidase
LENPILVSFAKAEMPIFSGIGLSGFGVRSSQKKPMGPNILFIKILWLKLDVDIVFWSLDCLYVPNFFADAITDMLCNTYKVSRSNIVFGATHTHSSYEFGFFKGEGVKKNDESKLINVGLKLVESAALEFNHAQMFKFGACTDHITVNRRRTVFNFRNSRLESTSLPNITKANADIVSGMSIVSSSGEKFILVSFACHPVFDRGLSISSDYPGEITKRLVDEGVCSEAIFFQGFGADIRPNYVVTRLQLLSKKLSFRESLKVLAYGDIFRELGPVEFEDFCAKLTLAISNAKKIQITVGNTRVHEKSFDLFSDTGKFMRPLHVKVIFLANEICLLSMSGEIHAMYKDLFSELNVITISCTNNVIGYLPDCGDYQQGGYEVVKSALNFGWDAPISEGSLISLKKDLGIWLKETGLC